ncbi:HAD-IA family hydrolase [Vibrio quintilis]|uniref:Sugar phosphatase YfbT n=1 Tax=Vibrio quintilis TaxID=1117707 RepID=A0A1M7YTH2_9VIBR|nr:HAD-IA family hydrolase [Vibrio quintilis]SHO55947.1 Sugar phosphatase YfbT [Vibrio quintilis]
MKTIHCKGCLFDLDGTLIDSMAAVNRSWSALAIRHNLNPDEVLSVIHGRPASESVAELLADKPNIIQHEVEWLKKQETEDTRGITPLPGAISLLNNLNDKQIPWAIVTSGSDPVAQARIAAAGIPQPQVLITADQITQGKPDPEPYLLGASRLGLQPAECLVFEDAIAGVKSGLAAQSKVIGLLTHATKAMLMNVECIEDYRYVTAEKTIRGAEIIIA